MKKNFNIACILFSLMFTMLLSCEKEEMVTPSEQVPKLKPVWKIAESAASDSSKDSIKVVVRK